jgi:2-haloacid dehalogenase
MTDPKLVLLDVNGTLSDTSPLSLRLRQAGLPSEALQLWLAMTLREGFGLTAAGAFAGFESLLEASLEALLAQATDLREDPQTLRTDLLGRFQGLGVHPDVGAGLEQLTAGGARVCTLSNGSSDYAARLLARSGSDGFVDRHFSAEEVGRWKPAPEPYLHAVRESGADPAEAILVAVHPWDIDGAKRAGLRGAWLDRDGGPYPKPLLKPDLEADSLPRIAAALSSV